MVVVTVSPGTRAHVRGGDVNAGPEEAVLVKLDGVSARDSATHKTPKK